ncbi:MFS transporter [Brevundimonas sp. SL130]|uniref:MFS transporter n=1 Tax=Brevundimonas sp. SL130 TaxID=2995143 RepID=UPI00226C87ED|nr:MFS transporter [Brevundimonas sp. SL130]WAC58539.1 MFS transporter [Brevundimonas sp. SL130]
MRFGSKWRAASHYALMYGGLGVSLPYAGLWMKAQGLSGAEIGVLLAAPMLGRLVTGPAIAVWADGFQYRRTPIALLAGLAALGYGAAGLVDGFLAWAVCWFVAATGAAAILPLTDVLVLRRSRRDGFAFAVPRGFGSAAFVAANIAMGFVLRTTGTEAVIVVVTLTCVGIGLTAWRVLPLEPVHDGPPLAGWERFRGMGRLLKDPVLVTALAAIGTVQAAHAFYYGFSAIVWREQGIEPHLTGILWAFAVVAEIALMWVFEPWRRRRGIGAWPILMIAAGAAMVRWLLMAAAPPLWALWPLQALHAVSFAANYLAGVELIERLAPRDSQTAAQTLNSTLSAGVLIGVATLASGPLYDAWGAGGYLAMAGLAGLGLIAGLALKPMLGARA